MGPNFQFRRARGTPASPSAVQANDGILFLVGKGYGSTRFSSGGRANISMYAAETWTDTAQGTYMSFKTTQIGTTTQTEKMRITDAGSVGIGTTNPVGPLHVAGVEYYTAPALLSSLSGDVIGATLTLDSTPATNGKSYSIISTGTTADTGAGSLGVFSDTDGIYRMVIGPTGNVGIGTTSPTAPLHVKYPSANVYKGTPAVVIDNPTGGEQTALIFSVDNSEMGRIRADKIGDLVVSTMANGAFLIRNQDLDTSTLMEVTPDVSTPDGQTALLIRRNIGGTFTLQPVSMGPTDSGGTGYRVLRVPN